MAAGHLLTDDEQITKDIYDQLSHRYNEDKNYLSVGEKVALLMAAASDALTTEDKITQLTREVEDELQARCDKAAAFLDRVEKGAETYDKENFYETFMGIIPNRLYDDCFDIPGLENTLARVYQLNSRAMAIIDAHTTPVSVSELLARPATGLEDPVKRARYERLQQVLAEEKKALAAEGLTGEALEEKAWNQATLRIARQNYEDKMAGKA